MLHRLIYRISAWHNYAFRAHLLLKIIDRYMDILSDHPSYERLKENKGNFKNKKATIIKKNFVEEPIFMNESHKH